MMFLETVFYFSLGKTKALRIICELSYCLNKIFCKYDFN
jgi:hypothetical protein